MASRAKRRRNPWLAVLNAKGKGTPIGVGVREIVYDRHATHGRGPWVHKFKRGDVEVRGLAGGRVLVESKGGAPVWSRDGRAGWLDNPGKRNADDWGPGKDYRSVGPYKTVAQLHKAARTLLEHVHPSSVMASLAHMALRQPNAVMGQPNYQHELADFVRHYVSPARRGKFTKNPGGTVAKRRKGTKRRASRKRKPPRGFRSWGAYMASIRPGGKSSSGKKARKRRATTGGAGMSRKRRKSRRRRSNPPRATHRRSSRRHGRRSFRRNPGGGFRGIIGTIMDGVKGGLGVVAGKAISRAVPALVGIQPTGYLGLGVQALVGVGAYMAADRFVGREPARTVLYGAFGGVIESIVRGWNVPVLSPALGDETELHAIAGYVHGYVPQGDGAKSAALGGGDMVDAGISMGV